MAAAPVPSLLRGFSAPVKLSGMTPDRLRFLAAHDTDPFVRWESGQQYATQVAARAWSRRFSAARRRRSTPALVAAVAATLRWRRCDPAFAAEAMSLPGETFLADQMAGGRRRTRSTPCARPRAPRSARSCTPRCAQRYERLTDTGNYRIDGASIGRRALRNVCLAYIAAGNQRRGATLAKSQFDAGRT